MQKFIEDFKFYFKYIIYAARAELKSEVANSYLNWIWWILEPICFMLIYAFISVIVFKSKEPYFIVFVFAGLSIWTFFQQTVTTSVRLVAQNKGIVTKVFVPKFVLILVKLFKNAFKMGISFILVLIGIILYRIPFHPMMLWLIPLLFLVMLVTFAFSTILLHFGVFIEDLANITNIALRLVFYLSGIFYSIGARVPAPYNRLLLNFNPVALLIDSSRKVLINAKAPNYQMLLAWFLLGTIISLLGLNLIYKNENSYVKVIK